MSFAPDGTWLTARSPEYLSAMICELEKAAKKVGLKLRLSTCRWSEVQRQDQQAAPVSEACRELRSMAQVDTTATMSVFGAEVHMQAYAGLGFAQICERRYGGPEGACVPNSELSTCPSIRRSRGRAALVTGRQATCSAPRRRRCA